MEPALVQMLHPMPELAPRTKIRINYSVTPVTNSQARPGRSSRRASSRSTPAPRNTIRSVYSRIIKSQNTTFPFW